ncbi:hypothetical protein TWF481_006183 [Arthrobotrys musiformis]|uniref:F-box domain-containing protein n=1 Tax=Arthrobotrys musiformis TaxID=47236 RepID=A0AAV9WG02_9PEZI
MADKGLLSLPAELHVEILANLTLGDQLRASQALDLWSELLLNSEVLKRTRYATVGPGIRGFHQLVAHQGGLMCTFTEGILQDYLYICNEKRPTGEDQLIFDIFESDKQKISRLAPRFSISQHPILDEPVISPAMLRRTTPEAGGPSSERQPHYGLERDYYGHRKTLQVPRAWNPADGQTVREFIQTIARIARADSTHWANFQSSQLNRRTEMLFWHGWDGEDEGSLEPIVDGIVYYKAQ